MSKRILRTVPAAVLVTTALAWNLPAAAQGTPAMPPGTAASGAMQKSPAPRANSETGRASPATSGAAFGGGAPATPALPRHAGRCRIGAGPAQARPARHGHRHIKAVIAAARVMRQRR